MTRKQNLDIRSKAKEEGVKLYEVAKALGIHPATLSVELRYELPEARKAELFYAISVARKEQEKWEKN